MSILITGQHDSFEVDIAVTEEHVREAEATQHPIEKGSNVTDHVILRPARVVLDCIVSDTPIGPLAERRRAAGFIVGDATEGFVPSDEAHRFLTELHES